MIALVALALAGELPAPPPPPEPVAEDCPASVPLAVGKAPPVGLLDAAGRVTCSGVVVGTGELADLLRVEAWGRSVYDVARIDAAACLADSVAASERERFWRELAERPTVAPVVYVGVGIVAGVAITAVAGWALGQVDVTE